MADTVDANADSRKLRKEETEHGASKNEGRKAAELSSSNASNPNKGEHGEKKEGRPSKFIETWAKIGLDMGTVTMMFKGSVAPIIAVAFYQADSVGYCWT